MLLILTGCVFSGIKKSENPARLWTEAESLPAASKEQPIEDPFNLPEPELKKILQERMAQDEEEGRPVGLLLASARLHALDPSLSRWEFVEQQVRKNENIPVQPSSLEPLVKKHLRESLRRWRQAAADVQEHGKMDQRFQGRRDQLQKMKAQRQDDLRSVSVHFTLLEEERGRIVKKMGAGASPELEEQLKLLESKNRSWQQKRESLKKETDQVESYLREIEEKQRPVRERLREAEIQAGLAQRELRKAQQDRALLQWWKRHFVPSPPKMRREDLSGGEGRVPGESEESPKAPEANRFWEGEPALSGQENITESGKAGEPFSENVFDDERPSANVSVLSEGVITDEIEEMSFEARLDRISRPLAEARHKSAAKTPKRYSHPAENETPPAQDRRHLQDRAGTETLLAPGDRSPATLPLTRSQARGWRKFPSKAATLYQVERGDTLPLIAAKIYGNPARWPAIYHTNQNAILRGLLETGQWLLIP